MVVEQALHDANHSLQVALQKLAYGESLLEDQDLASSDDEPSADPEDLAAAFFAQQAKKKQQETKLPIHKWAHAIAACRDEQKSTMTETLGTTAGPPEIGPQSQYDFRNQVIDAVFLDFQRLVQQKEEASSA
jgi:hypothetical protein